MSQPAIARESADERAGAVARAAPRVPHRVPWLGRAIDFGRDPDGFMRQCVERYGSAFTVLLPGGPRTFLTDPFDFPAFFHTRELVFRDIADVFGARVFGYDSALLQGDVLERLVEAVHLPLKGDALIPITERMNRLFLDRLLKAIGSDWVHDSLFRFCNEHVFAAGGDALFGDGFSSPELHRSYALLDRWFTVLAAGAPAWTIPGVRAAQTHLADALAVPRANRSWMMEQRAAIVESLGVSPREAHRLNSTVVWASQANTIATAFWTVLLVLRDPHAREEILAELGEVGGVLSYDALREMRKLDSAITEVTRLMSIPLTVRAASTDLELDLASGRRLLVRKGEVLYPYPRLTHLDPEIFADPHVFKFDRFFTPSGAKHFYKNGQRVAFCLLPFGGGKSMCPGRFFARNEFKIVVATLLSAFEIELQSAEVPGLVLSRVGLGVPPPTKDMPIRIRRRPALAGPRAA